MGVGYTAVMSFWSRLIGDVRDPLAAAGNPNPEPPRYGAPVTVWVLARRLSATFSVHDVEGSEHRFLSAVSQGLSVRRQREIVFTVRIAQGEDLVPRMRELSAFYATVRRLAWRGKRVTAGGFTHFKTRGLFGRGDSGLLYATARPMRGVELPPQAISAIAVDAAEVRAAIDHGTYRVLTRIGEVERSFPFPTWSDLGRASVVNERERESVLGKVPRNRVAGVSFLAEDKRVRVLLSPGAREAMGSGLASMKRGQPFALLTEPAAGANALLVWHPGQTEPAIISPAGSDGSRMTGSCLMVVPGGQKDEARLFEDGYSLLFSTRSWGMLCAALLEQRPYSLELTGGSKLEFEWLSGNAAPAD